MHTACFPPAPGVLHLSAGRTDSLAVPASLQPVRVLPHRLTGGREIADKAEYLLPLLGKRDFEDIQETRAFSYRAVSPAHPGRKPLHTDRHAYLFFAEQYRPYCPL